MVHGGGYLVERVEAVADHLDAKSVRHTHQVDVVGAVNQRVGPDLEERFEPEEICRGALWAWVR